MDRFVYATGERKLRRSFTSSHSRVASTTIRSLLTDAPGVASVRVNTLIDRDGMTERSPRSGEHSLPPGLYETLCTRRLSCAPKTHRLTPDRNVPATRHTRRHLARRRPHPAQDLSAHGRDVVRRRSSGSRPVLAVPSLLDVVAARYCRIMRANSTTIWCL